MATRNSKSAKRSTAKAKIGAAANGHATAREPMAGARSTTPEQIQVRAYELFIARGATHGDDLADWFRAERELSR